MSHKPNHPLIQCNSETIEFIEAADPVEGEAPKPPTISAVSYNGGPMRVSGYALPVVIDLDNLEGLGKEHAVYREHDHSRILGSGVTTREGNSLKLNARATNDTPDTAEVVRLGKARFPFEASVGVAPTKIVKLAKGESAVVNGQTVAGPVNIVHGKLKETSVVQHGADDTTAAAIAASSVDSSKEKTMSKSGFAAYLEERGFVEAELSEKQLATLSSAYNVEIGIPKETVPQITAAIDAKREKERRHAAYYRIIEAALDKGMSSETATNLVEAAINDNLSETDFELNVLRLSRTTGTTTVPSRSREISQEVIEASIARSAIVDTTVEKMFKPEVLEASEKAFPRGLSLVEFLQVCAKRNGFVNISHRDTRALLEGAFSPVRAAAAGPSTYDVSGILSNIANKMIRDAFMGVEQEWAKMASVGVVNDLKKHTTYSLTGDMSYEQVGTQGELKHATLGSEKYENQASTYGRVFGLSEDDILNDDLGAFNRIQRLLGRGSALALNKVIWKAFLANSATFWTAARNNRLSGAASALSIGALTTASTALEKQVDPDGEPMGLQAAVLVVPIDLKIYANQLANDTEIRMDASAAPTTYSIKNPHAGKFMVASSSYLNNAKIPGGSATHWALLADPMDMPTIEVVFLNGQQSPRIEQARANFDTLGIYFRGVHRFGAAMQEYRASVYSVGV